MLTKNVIYGTEPDRVIVQRIAKTARALVSFPVDVHELEDGGGWMADEVYDINRPWSEGLVAEIDAHYEAWLADAMVESIPQATLDDVVEAINELADIVLGGE